MTKFTPGPWQFYKNSVITDKYSICFMPMPKTGITDEIKANARLIAAAPAMYEALKEGCYQLHIAYNQIPGFPTEARKAFDQMRNALALADGKSSNGR